MYAEKALIKPPERPGLIPQGLYGLALRLLTFLIHNSFEMLMEAVALLPEK